MTQYELPDGFQGMETAPKDGTIVNTVSASGGYWNEMAPYSIDMVGWAPIVPPKKKRWRADKGEAYWLVTYSGVVTRTTEAFAEWDNRCYASGNYFRTIEDAQASPIYKAFQEMRKP